MKAFLHHIHHLFTPRESNNYRAKTLHIDFLTFYLITALALTMIFKLFTPASANVLGVATDINIDKLYQLTNDERQKAGLSTLTYNDKLADAARRKAQDMFDKNYWAHYSPDGRTPWDFILDAGYQYEYAGENLAKNFMFSDAVVQAWMDSPSHRENILRPEYTEIGFAVANGVLNGEETTLVVQMFGKPLNNSVAAAPPPVAVQAQEIAPTTAVVPTIAAITSTTSVPEPTQIIPTITTVNTQSSTKISSVHENNPQLFPAYLNMNLVFLFVLLIALIADFYFAKRLRFVRVTGKNIAHGLFVLFIIASIYIISKGAIL